MDTIITLEVKYWTRHDNNFYKKHIKTKVITVQRNYSYADLKIKIFEHIKNNFVKIGLIRRTTIEEVREIKKDIHED
jgi:hypothetical protein